MNKGYILLHRQIQDCWIWDDKPFTKGQAWIDLLLLANHSDKKIGFNGKPITIERGQYLTSIRVLAERWGWSNSRTLNYLKLLENDKMIERDSDRTRTLLTIVNYEVYQVSETPTEHQPNTNRTPAEHEPNETINYTINDNTLNKKRGAFTPPTVEEVRTYCNERHNGIDAEAFVTFYESKGWMIGKNKMKDWKAAVRTWEKRRKDDNKGFIARDNKEELNLLELKALGQI
jgi:DNA replication protein DnaD